MKKFVPLLFVFFATLIISFQFSSCASSRPKSEEPSATPAEEDLGEIERLLGITEEDKKQQTKKEKEGDDLLTLLKADEDKGTTPTGGAQGGGDVRLTNLQKKVDDMEGQLMEKNRTIADLKAQLMMKDEELKRYKSGGGTAQPANQYYSPPVSGSTSYSGGSEYERTYDQALDLFHSAQYRDAMSLFESLLTKNRNHSLSDNAQYWIGECNYALGNYRAAILAFEKVFTFSQSNKNDYAQYKLGLCYQKLGDSARAREEFQNLVDNYSNEELLARAQEKLAQLR
jgi:tol-pal system protein YbgF